MADSSSTIVQPPKDRRNTITVALSARALFDLETENKFYKENGLEAYIQHMVERENEVLGKGPAFEFVEKDEVEKAHENVHVASYHAAWT